jgi:hypothetical protein
MSRSRVDALYVRRLLGRNTTLGLGAAKRQRPKFQPRLEALEERLVPADYGLFKKLCG